MAGSRCRHTVPGEGEQVREQAAGLRGAGARWDETEWERAWRRGTLAWSAPGSPAAAASRLSLVHPRPLRGEMAGSSRELSPRESPEY